MVRNKLSSKSLLINKIMYSIMSLILFYLIYSFTGWYAGQLPDVDIYVFDFEKYIPFIPWMVVPYMSSGIFFILIFYLCPTNKDLLLLTKRINFITIVSGLFFFIAPLKFSFRKPDIHNHFLAYLFDGINTLDTVYNQAPSLHVSYAIIFLTIIAKLQNKTLRVILYTWIILMATATLTIYQHHFIDIACALTLVSFTFYLFPTHKTKNQSVSYFYFTMSFLCLLINLHVYKEELNFFINILFGWMSIMLIYIGIVYRNLDNKFLKEYDGNIPTLKKIFFIPYITTYNIMRYFFCKTKKEDVTEIIPSLFIGPRLGHKSLKQIGFQLNDTIIIDLMAEVEECLEVKKTSIYFCFPILDIADANDEYIKDLTFKILEIYNQNHLKKKIYMHCLMGYSRSASIATLLLSRIQNIPIYEAAKEIQTNYKQSLVYKHLLSLKEIQV